MSIKYNEFGEVISVNGLTTGQHIGRPMQDAIAERPEDNEVYATQHNTVTNCENTNVDELPKPVAGGVSSWNDLTDRPFYESDTVMVGSTAVSYGVVMTDGRLFIFEQASKRDKNGMLVAINTRPELVRCDGIITVNGSMDMAANFNKVTTISADLDLGSSGVAVYELTSDTYGDTAKITLTTNINDYSIIFAFENCVPVMANLYGAEWEYGVAKQLDEKYLPDSVKGGGSSAKWDAVIQLEGGYNASNFTGYRFVEGGYATVRSKIDAGELPQILVRWHQVYGETEYNVVAQATHAGLTVDSIDGCITIGFGTGYTNTDVRLTLYKDSDIGG